MVADSEARPRPRSRCPLALLLGDRRGRLAQGERAMRRALQATGNHTRLIRSEQRLSHLLPAPTIGEIPFSLSRP